MNGKEMDEARQAQSAYAWEQNELRDRQLRRQADLGPLPEEFPQEYDDWQSCSPLTFFGLFAVYTYENKREGRLRRGDGPFYCPRCEEPQEDWQKLRCWECAWPTKIRAYAIELAQGWHETRAAYQDTGIPVRVTA